MISKTLFFALVLQIPPGVVPGQEAGAVFSPQQEAALDSVQTEMARGRDWRAVRQLRAAFPQGPGGNEDLVLLFARAEAGWSHWPEVVGLLETPLAGGEVNRPEAWLLLGRALMAQERWEEAEAAFGQALDVEVAEESERSLIARALRARSRGRLGMYPEALTDLAEIGPADSTLAAWVALEMAERTAAAGYREETRQLLSTVESDALRQLGWNLLPLSLLVSGDSTGAEAAFWSALPSLSSGLDQAAAWDRVGSLRLARGDSVGAKGAFHQVLSLQAPGSHGLNAARNLLELGFDSVGVALAGARTLAGAGRHQDALDVYDVYESLLEGSPPPSVLLAQTRSHLNLGQGRDALALATQLGESDDSEIGAPALALRVQALRQLGRGAEVRGVQDELMVRFPERPEAVEILFYRADALETRGDREGAIRGYGETAELAPSQSLAGQARMRMGQILLGMGRDEAALDVYLAYLGDFPEGRRFDEAAFWAGRLLFSLDRTVEAREILFRLREEYPLSYYSVRAGELLGEPFAPSVQEGQDSLPFPGFLREGLARFDRLRAVGLEDGAVWEANAMADRLRSDTEAARREGVLLRLARELNSRGFTREGINLGWELRRDGRPWDRDLLAAVYPFPYREIVLAEARERGVDPFLIAGLIRQESAFWAEARSRADARGLMQVLPSTGRELARAAGFVGFDPDEHLFEAQINIHLGVLFFFDMRRRFGEDLPIILSAYNAGPTRARRWREFPEAQDMPRFVERIPFVETRGYVKNVTANQAIYTWLYGAVADDPGSGRGHQPVVP